MLLLKSAYDIAVIGAGVFGAWTASHLHRAGQSVILLDAWGAGHSRASSGGESRVIRMGYGADAIYTRMALRSLALWQELAERTGQVLFHRTGVLWMAREDDPYSSATRINLEAAGVPIEMVRGPELATRFPQMRIADSRAYGILEPKSGALMARRGVAAVVEDAAREGMACAVEAVRPPSSGRSATVLTISGEAIRAGVFVFACGPWLPKLFPRLLGKRIFPTRQEVFFFAPPAGERRFAPPHLPV